MLKSKVSYKKIEGVYSQRRQKNGGYEQIWVRYKILKILYQIFHSLSQIYWTLILQFIKIHALLLIRIKYLPPTKFNNSTTHIFLDHLCNYSRIGRDNKVLTSHELNNVQEVVRQTFLIFCQLNRSKIFNDIQIWLSGKPSRI